MSTIANNIFSRFAKAREKTGSVLPLNVQSYSVEGALARTVVRIPDSSAHRVNNQEVAAALAVAIPKARFMNGSIMKEGNELYTLFLSSSQRTMTKEQAAAESLIEIATNVFRDADDNIWSLTEDASGTYFTAQETEDFDSLIKGVRSRQIATASLEIALAESFNAGCYLAAYDVASEGYQFGLAVDESSVYFPAADAIKPVSPHMVTWVHENAAKVDGPSVSKVLDYYRRLYGHNAAFFKELEKVIRKQFLAA